MRKWSDLRFPSMTYYLRHCAKYYFSCCRLCGFEPFWDDGGEVAICRKVVQGNYSFPSPWWDDVSDSAKDLITQVIFLNILKILSKSLEWKSNETMKKKISGIKRKSVKKTLHHCDIVYFAELHLTGKRRTKNWIISASFTRREKTTNSRRSLKPPMDARCIDSFI